jgi:hypothetical protein
MELLEWVIIGFSCLLPFVYCLLWRLVKLGVVGAALSFITGYFLAPLGAIAVAVLYTYTMHHLIQKALEYQRNQKATVYSTGRCQGDS